MHHGFTAESQSGHIDIIIIVYIIYIYAYIIALKSIPSASDITQTI